MIPVVIKAVEYDFLHFDGLWGCFLLLAILSLLVAGIVNALADKGQGLWLFSGGLKNDLVDYGVK